MNLSAVAQAVRETHAPLAPSSAPQWANCSGSVMANMHVPDKEHPRTRAGTASHWVVSECLEKWKNPDEIMYVASDWLGSTAPNGVVIDEEMAEGAQVFIDNALFIASSHGALQSMLIEHHVWMPQIHKDNDGTLDLGFVLLNRDDDGRVCSGKIYLIDYKYGHRECKAKGNYQLIDYLAGLLNEYKIDGEAEQFIEVEFQIVQPFCYQSSGSIDTWTVSVSDLRGYITQMISKANDAFTNPTFSSGNWCRDCKAIHRCHTAQKSDYSLIDYVNDPCVILSMNGANLSTELEILRQGEITLKARKEAIEEELMHRLGKGEATDSGYCIETKYGRLAWSVPPKQVIALASMFGIDADKEATLTPTQTLAKASPEAKPMLEEAMKSMSARPSGGLKLIEAKDSYIARAFTKGK